MGFRRGRENPRTLPKIKTPANWILMVAISLCHLEMLHYWQINTVIHLKHFGEEVDTHSKKPWFVSVVAVNDCKAILCFIQ